MSKTACVIAFALGAAVGTVVSWKLLETTKVVDASTKAKNQ